MKDYTKNTYFKQFKNGRLKFFTKLYLNHCGKRDARKKVIRKNAKGTYVSPFIYQEIYLYQLALQMEDERITNSTMSAQTEYNVFEAQIAQKEAFIKQSEATVIPEKSSSSVEENIISYHRAENFAQAISILKAKQTELSLFQQQETEIGELRSKQLHSMLQAKIAAYWDGVLQACSNNQDIPPIVIVSQLIQEGV